MLDAGGLKSRGKGILYYSEAVSATAILITRALQQHGADDSMFSNLFLSAESKLVPTPSSILPPLPKPHSRHQPEATLPRYCINAATFGQIISP